MPSETRSPTVDVLGIRVDALDLAGLLARVDTLIRKGRSGAAAGVGGTIAYVNVHVANESVAHEDVRRFLNDADICYCDGAGIVLGARLLGHSLPGRMTGADWIWDLAAHAEGRYHLYWLGSEPGVTAAAAARLQARHPGLQITTDHGFHAKHGPENTALIERINAAHPDIVLVGMGTPLQERWTAENRAAIDAPIVWVLGATADFVSGKVQRGPAWLHQRQEWVARLLVDPRRLWKRYLVGNGLFLLRIGGQRAREAVSQSRRPQPR